MAAKEAPYISHSIAPHLPFTFNNKRRISFFLRFGVLKTCPTQSAFLIGVLLCNSLLCFPWLCSTSTFLSVKFPSSSVALILIILPNFLFHLCLFLLPFYMVCSLGVTSSPSYSCSTPSIVFCSLLFVSFSYSLMLFLLFFLALSFFWFISSTCTGCCVVCSYSWSFSFVVSLCPPPGQRAHLKKKTVERTLISFCLPACFFAKLSFQTSLCFSLVDIKHVCFISWNMF